VKVLHINQSDIQGGAAIAAYRLHRGLISNSIDSKLLVGTPQLLSDEVATTPKSPFIEKQTSRLAWRLGLNYINLHSTFRVPSEEFFSDADVVNFHNLHGSYFNYLALPKLTSLKPAVWTLHDMWSFTGHCAYSLDCERWKTGCGHCPYPNTNPPIRHDSTRLEWKLKRWVYSKSKLVFVTPSRWLQSIAKQSIIGSFPVFHIPYGIDTRAFKPLDPLEARAKLGLPGAKSIIMFAAQDLSDWRKGGDLLVKALEMLSTSLKRESLLLLLGGKASGFKTIAGIEAASLGYITEDERKALAYSAADVFVLPTRGDNLPLVLQESMACGTPAVSFDVGGVGDLVLPGQTGFLAKPEDCADLALGISNVLGESGKSSKLRDRCREMATTEFDIRIMVKRYRELYESLISQTES